MIKEAEKEVRDVFQQCVCALTHVLSHHLKQVDNIIRPVPQRRAAKSGEEEKMRRKMRRKPGLS